MEVANKNRFYPNPHSQIVNANPAPQRGQGKEDKQVTYRSYEQRSSQRDRDRDRERIGQSGNAFSRQQDIIRYRGGTSSSSILINSYQDPTKREALLQQSATSRKEMGKPESCARSSHQDNRQTTQSSFKRPRPDDRNWNAFTGRDVKRARYDSSASFNRTCSYEESILAIGDHFDASSEAWEWEEELGFLMSTETVKDFVTTLQNASKIPRPEYALPDELFFAIKAHLKKVIQQSPEWQLERQNWSINISRLLYSFKQFNENGKGLSALLLYVAELLDDESKPFLNTQRIGNALYGLQNLSDSKELRAVLKALVPHIKNVDQFDPLAIDNALYGLQNLPESAEVAAMLKALTEKIKLLHPYDVVSPEIFLAETISSLRKKLINPSSQAHSLVAQLSTQFALSLNTQQLHSITGQEKVVIDLVGGPSPSGSIDLHCLSHGLAGFYVEAILKQSQRGDSVLRIVYGKASHSKHSTNKMREVVEQAVSNNLAYQEWESTWLEGRVIVRRALPPLVSDTSKGDVKQVRISARTSVETVAATPPQVKIMGIRAGISTEAMAAIPSHVVLLGIDGEISAEAMAAIPPHIQGICLLKGVSAEVVRAIPPHIKYVQLSASTSVEAVRAIPEHIKVVSIGADIPAEVMHAIPPHVWRMSIHEGVSAKTVHEIPSHITRGDIGSGASEEAVGAIPEHVTCVGISAGTSVRGVRVLPKHISRVYIAEGTPLEVVAAIPQHVRCVRLHSKTPSELTEAIPSNIAEIEVTKSWAKQFFQYLQPVIAVSPRTIRFV